MIPKDIDIPEKLAISGKRGAKRLRVLQRRMKHLKKRIEDTDRRLCYDEHEYTSLRWAISQIIYYETQLNNKSS